MALHLIIGNKNYSSWSFRPWLAMKVAGIAFEETVISLEARDFKARVTALSGAGRVPVLIDGDVRVWESLAILEYLAEKFPAAGLWPKDAGARAHARAVASEMHAGFLPLRRHLPMNVWRPVKPRALDDGAATDVARIEAIWSECRAQIRRGGRFCSAVRRGRRHVCAGGLALPHLCGRGRAPPRAPTWRGHGAAGMGGMAGCGAARVLGAAARRSRLAGRVARVNIRA